MGDTRRDKVSLRLSPTGLAAIDRLAAEHKVSRSVVLRTALSVGLTAPTLTNRLREARTL